MERLRIERRRQARRSGGPGPGRRITDVQVRAGVLRRSPAGIREKLVVIGQGKGSAAVARFLSLWGRGRLEVTLINCDLPEASPSRRRLPAFDRRVLGHRYGVRVIDGTVVCVDPLARSVSMADGTRLPFDRLEVVLDSGLERLAWIETSVA